MAYSASSKVIGGVVVSLLMGFPFFASAQMTGAADHRPRITVLYDAFGLGRAMQKDWGYAAFIEYAGKRILFDTGSNPTTLARNAKAERVDLSKLDFIVMSLFGWVFQPTTFGCPGRVVLAV